RLNDGSAGAHGHLAEGGGASRRCSAAILNVRFVQDRGVGKANITAMTLRFDLVGVVVASMPASLAFYRLLGLSIPPEWDHERHVEVRLASGLRLAWDTEDVIASVDPS